MIFSGSQPCLPCPQAALAAQLPPASITFGSPVAAVEPTEAGAALRLASGQRLECLAVVGADGTRSAVAAAAGRAAPNYCGQTAIRWVAGLDSSAAAAAPAPAPVEQADVALSPPSDRDHPSLCCRGIARFPGGVPAELQAACIRQVWGPGARAGTYQISGGQQLGPCRGGEGLCRGDEGLATPLCKWKGIARRCALQAGRQRCARAHCGLGLPAVAPAWLPTPLLSLLGPSDTELYWFCCFNAPAEPSAAAASPEAWRQEALGVVRGWAWGLPQAVEATPAEDLSRSRLVDR